MTARTAKTNDAVLAQTITREVAKRVVGQEVMVERLLIGLFTGGHILLEGVSGLAKTLAVKTVAECLKITFSRIQFTPDLLPADVIGTMVYDQRSQEFYPKKGPLFANLVLADEINRAPAKVQSALHEVREQRPLLRIELLRALVVHHRADHVGGQQVGRELDPREGDLQTFRDGLHRQRLGQSRHAFEQNVATGKQADQQALDHDFLADDALRHFAGDGLRQHRV